MMSFLWSHIVHSIHTEVVGLTNTFSAVVLHANAFHHHWCSYTVCWLSRMLWILIESGVVPSMRVSTLLIIQMSYQYNHKWLSVSCLTCSKTTKSPAYKNVCMYLFRSQVRWCINYYRSPSAPNRHRKSPNWKRKWVLCRLRWNGLKINSKQRPKHTR